MMDREELVAEIILRYGNFLKTKEVAEYLKMHPGSIRRYAVHKQLSPDHNLGGTAGLRFSATEVVNFIISRRPTQN